MKYKFKQVVGRGLIVLVFGTVLCTSFAVLCTSFAAQTYVVQWFTLHPLDRLSIAYRQSQRQTRVLAGQANWQRLCVNGRTLACGCCVEELGAKNTRQTSPRNPSHQSVSCTIRLTRKTYSYRHENKLTSIQTCRNSPTHKTRAQTGGRQDSASAQWPTKTKQRDLDGSPN